MDFPDINNSVALMSRTLQKLEIGRDETFGGIIPAQQPLALNKDDDDIVSVPAKNIRNGTS